MNVAEIGDDDERKWAAFSTQPPYHVSAWAYFNRSFNLFPKSANDPVIQFYCALELRCAIERVFFEYFAHIRQEPLTNSELNLWAPKSLKAAILALEPDFLEKIDFLNVVQEAYGVSQRFAIPELDRLSKDYGLLGDYLHARRTPVGTTGHPDWWIKFRRLHLDLLLPNACLN